MKYLNSRNILNRKLRHITAMIGNTTDNEIIKNLAILNDDLLATKEVEKECRGILGTNCPFGNEDCPTCYPSPSLDGLEEIEPGDLAGSSEVVIKIAYRLNEVIKYLKNR